jgi:hypothetical protein
VTNLHDAAQKYAERAWPVFPCEVRGKAPLGRLAPHGLKNATVDLAVIDRWWTSEPDANIGIATGIAFDVLDVDGYEGWKTLAQIVAEFGCLNSAPVSMTPSEGAHYLFRPTGVGNRAGFRPALDWRGRGGYVVVPPSIGAHGAVYEWAVDPDEQALEPAPTWLVALLEKKSEPRDASINQGSTTTYGRRALEAEVGRVLLAPVGERNHALNRAAFALGQLIAGGEVDIDAAYDALEAAALRCGLGAYETEHTIESGLSNGLRTPRTAPR